jgi:hypothetical protein
MTDVTGEVFDGFDTEAALTELWEIKREMEDLDARRKELQAEVAKRHTIKDRLLFLDRAGNKHTAQVVRSSIPVIDVIGLKEELAEDVFERISEHTIKAKVLEEAVITGLVPEPIAKRHVQYKERAPYVKF